MRESGENHVLDLNHTENGRERTAQDPKRNKGYTIVSKIYIYIYIHRNIGVEIQIQNKELQNGAKSIACSRDRTRWACQRSSCHSLHWKGFYLTHFPFPSLSIYAFVFAWIVLLYFVDCVVFLVSDYRGRAASIEEVSSDSLFFFSSVSLISLLLLSFRAILLLYLCFRLEMGVEVMLCLDA